jgi:hypothetical protein
MLGKFAKRQELRLPFLSEEILDLQGLVASFYVCAQPKVKTG